MKTKFDGANDTVKTYNKGAGLKPCAFYVDSGGDLVITDWVGEVACVVAPDEVYSPASVEWPIMDTNIKSVTITR